MTRQVAEQFRRLCSAYSTAAWMEPRDLEGAVKRLASAAQTNARSFERLIYPEVDAKQLRLDFETFGAELRGPSARIIGPEIAGIVRRATALASRDDAVWRSVARAQDGLPPPTLVYEAEALIASVPLAEAPERTISAREAAAEVSEAIERLEILGWNVVVDDAMSAAMAVNGPRRCVRVRRGDTFDAKQLARLIVHEVGGHVRRWHLASRQVEPMVALSLGASTTTEEGLALLGEEQADRLDPVTLRTYAARVLAVDTASRCGVLDVARQLTPILGSVGAARLALRVKRGMVDPNEPGGLTKDWGYLGGLNACRALLRDAPEDVALMRGVKWPLERLDDVRALAAAGRVQPAPPLEIDRLLGI